MGEKFDWSTAISWPSGNPTTNFLNPTTEGCSLDLLIQEEILPKDIINRSQIAEKLYNFINNNKKGYVLNLDSAWGSGKTWFVKRLFLELKNKHPVCYIDAWEHDYKGDAIFLLLHSLIKSLEEYQDEKSIIEKIKISKISIFSKKLAPEIFKSVTRLDLKRIIDETNADSSDTAKNKSYTDLLGAATKLLLDELDNETTAVNELKSNIAKLLDKSISSNKHSKRYPLIVFIDELDRCRPSFSVEMLESIKHIFSIPNIFFIISTHCNELQHSIKSVYGSGFSSEKYLEKFFDSKITLSSPETKNFVEMNTSGLIKGLINPNSPDLFYYDTKNFFEIISGIATAFNIPLRQIQKSLKELHSIYQLINGHSELNIIALTILIICRRELPHTYNDILRANQDLKTIKHFDHNKYRDITENSNHRGIAHHFNVKLALNGAYQETYSCMISDNCEVDAKTLMFSIINALTNPLKPEHIFTNNNYRSSVPTINVSNLAALNYSSIHNCEPSISRYIDAIEIGAFF